MATKPITPKLYFLVKPSIETKPVTKTIKYFFVMLHVVFALDFGFVKFNSWKTNVFVKLLTLTQSSIFFLNLTFAFFDPSTKTVLTYCQYFLDFIVYYVFTINLALMKNTFRNYQVDLYSFDAEIFVDSYSYNVEYKMIVWFSILLIYRIVSFTMYYVLSLDFSKFPLYNQLLYYVILLASDFILIVYGYAFSFAYERMKSFTSFVKKDATDVVSCQYLYKNLAEIVENVKKSFDLVLILSLLANTTDAILHVYYPFADKAALPASIFQKTFRETFFAFVAYAVVFQQLLVLFFPAFTAGLLANQVDKLRLVLYDRLLKEKSHAKDLKRFLGYVDGRPLRFRVWRVVPLDWRLPVIVINISITYIIVMIQFTHK